MQLFHADTSVLVVKHHYTLQHGEIMFKFMFNVFSEGI